jgi:hypothetical protein
MLAARFPGILPQMTQREALESAAVQSLDGGFDTSKWKTRPYRAPHHTASGVALVGGGVNRKAICDRGMIIATGRVLFATTKTIKQTGRPRSVQRLKNPAQIVRRNGIRGLQKTATSNPSLIANDRSLPRCFLFPRFAVCT